ncbi:MAG: LamG domain-containing protein [Proteobacteria bacterium]|nr:LamG domain-containing protein [Pseudomonadota bacterium]
MNDIYMGIAYGEYSPPVITASYNFDEKQWHEIKIVRDGGLYQFYINGSKILERNIPEIQDLSGGTILLQTSDGTFEVDDLLIRAIGDGCEPGGG